MSKTELARKAEVSPLTIARIEAGEKCRMETKRKIIFALGFRLEEKGKVFGNDEDNFHEAAASKKGEPSPYMPAQDSSAPQKPRGKRGRPPSISHKAPTRKKGSS